MPLFFHRLLVADTNPGKTGQICTGNEGIVEGDASKYHLNSPIGLAHHGDTGYIGASGKIVEMEGKFF